MRKQKVYQNGNLVKIGEHDEVRNILKKGVVKNIDDFGPLLNKETAPCFINTDGLEKIVVDGFELFIKPSTGFALSPNFSQSTELKGSTVYYQKIEP